MNKKTLLNLTVFIDNDKLDSYLKLVNKTYDFVEYTEKHHIIPQKYYKLLGIVVDNTEDNIVALTAFDHIYAHYLLCFCTTGKLNSSCKKAFLLMTQYNNRLLTFTEQEAIKELEYYAALRKEAQADISKITAAKNKGRKLSDEVKQKISLANKGKKKPAFSAEHKQKLSEARRSGKPHSTTAGKRSIYKKELNQVKFVCESELSKYLADGWVLGGKPLSNDAKLKIGASNSQTLKGRKHQAIAEGKTNSGLIGNKILCIETGTIFSTIEAAKNWLKESTGNAGNQIKNCCAGAREQTGGYHWKYIKDE